MQPDLTILCAVDPEKPAIYDRRFLAGLAALNGPGMHRVQVILVCQRPSSPDLMRLAAHQPYQVEVLYPGHPLNADGYPMWDVLEGMRLAAPRIAGRWVTFAHSEFLYGPGRLKKTMDWLCERQPLLAIGNLRRPIVESRMGGRREAPRENLNLLLLDLIDAGYWQFLADRWHLFTASNWIYWRDEPKPGRCPWQEDIFFADRGWLEALRFAEHGRPQYFQDVYDLVNIGTNILGRHGFPVAIERMPRDINEAVHLPHEKHWRAYTPATRDWFRQHAQRLRGTTHVERQDLWRELETMTDDGSRKRGHVVSDFRRAPGGTVTRWAAEFSGWVQGEGAARLREFENERTRLAA